MGCWFCKTVCSLPVCRLKLWCTLHLSHVRYMPYACHPFRLQSTGRLAFVMIRTLQYIGTDICDDTYLAIHRYRHFLSRSGLLTLHKSLPKTGRSNSDTARDSLFFYRSLYRYIEGGGKSKYCIIGNFCWQTSWALREGDAISGFVSIPDPWILYWGCAFLQACVLYWISFKI
jgi:hypothetical protein